jgi:hypothetical protein
MPRVRIPVTDLCQAPPAKGGSESRGVLRRWEFLPTPTMQPECQDPALEDTRSDLRRSGVMSGGGRARPDDLADELASPQSRTAQALLEEILSVQTTPRLRPLRRGRVRGDSRPRGDG